MTKIQPTTIAATDEIRLVRRMVATSTIALTVLAAYQILRGRFEPMDLSFLLGVFPLALSYQRLRAGRVNAGLALLAWGMWLVASLLGFIVGGIYTPILYVYPVLIMLAGWLQGRRQAYLMTTASIAVMATLVQGADAGWIAAAIRRNPTGTLMVYSAISVLAGVLSTALAERDRRRRAVEQALQHDLQSRLLELQRSEEAVRQLNSELELRVAARTAELSATVTELKLAQADLVEAEKLASLGALVAGVAHELNTPIGTTVTAASTLQDRLTNLAPQIDSGVMRRSALTDFVHDLGAITDLILRSSERAARLIASFKQVAVDRTSEQRRRFTLLALVQDVQSTLRSSYRNATWTIARDISPDIDCDSYPGPLGQIVTNLIQNAAIHAFDGRDAGTLTISAAADESDITMVFADDGKGMDAVTLARIFEPFFTTRLGQGGSGLGLSICRNIATGMLGGSLRAESAPGHGTQFTLKFPRIAPS